MNAIFAGLDKKNKKDFLTEQIFYDNMSNKLDLYDSLFFSPF